MIPRTAWDWLTFYSLFRRTCLEAANGRATCPPPPFTEGPELRGDHNDHIGSALAQGPSEPGLGIYFIWLSVWSKAPAAATNMSTLVAWTIVLASARCVALFLQLTLLAHFPTSVPSSHKRPASICPPVNRHACHYAS